MTNVRMAFSHQGTGAASVCGCHSQAGGKLRAFNEPPAVVGSTRVGGASSLFYPTGSGVWLLDIGAQPISNKAVVIIDDDIPTGTTLVHNLKGSTTGAFAGEEVNIGSVVNESTFTGKYRYFKLTSTFSSNSLRTLTPLVRFFSVTYPRGYPSQGTCNLLLDVGFTPEFNGSWEIVSRLPTGVSLALTAKASNEGLFTGEETDIGAIAHAGVISIRKRYYKVSCVFNSDADNIQTPALRRIKANFPNG